ncbi:hypothetical protein GVAV_003243 [Gurleya vavrai]
MTNNNNFINISSDILYKTACEGQPADYATDGDSSNEPKRDDLTHILNKLESLNIADNSQTKIYKFNKYNGFKKGQLANDFVGQFEPFKKEWKEEIYMRHFRYNLTEKAADWFDGAENMDFFDITTLKMEFIDFFGTKEENYDVQLIRKLSKNIYLEYFDNYCLAVRKIAKYSTMNFSKIHSVILGKVPRQIQSEIENCKNWKNMLGKAEAISLKYRYAKRKTYNSFEITDKSTEKMENVQ